MSADAEPALPAEEPFARSEVEPSSVVARYLFPTEKFRGEWRRHWVALAPEAIVAVGTTVLLGYAAGVVARRLAGIEAVLLVVWLIIVGWVGYRLHEWHTDRFILTNKRVMLVRGLVTRNVAMMPLLRVTDLKYLQSPLGRLLNFGTFEIESAGQDQALRKVTMLPRPNQLYLRIIEEMYEPEAVEARLASAAEPLDDEPVDW